jgi:hypothetical protein
LPSSRIKGLRTGTLCACIYLRPQRAAQITKDRNMFRPSTFETIITALACATVGVSVTLAAFLLLVRP